MGTHNPTPGSWSELDAVVADVVKTRAQIAALQARESELLAGAVDLVMAREAELRATGRRHSADIPLREVSAELATAMRLTDRTVQSRMGDAATLHDRFPSTVHAWRTGSIDAGHVGAILDAGSAIADEHTRAQFEARALEIASTETPSRLRTHARAIAAQLDPGATARRTRRAIDFRRIRLIDLDDGLARLLIDLPASLAYAVLDRLTQMAFSVHAADLDELSERRAGDVDDARPRVRSRAEEPAMPPHLTTGPSEEASRSVRTVDQIRADIVADLLLAGSPAAHGDGDALGAITAHVQVTVPALTLAGVEDAPALLAGYGPIDTETARRLAGAAPGWDRVLTHPFTGAVLAVDRYRPSAALTRHLMARDEHCRFPGCRRAARRCDIDHTIDAAHGGATCESNLAHFCRRHHTLKHATAWTVRSLGHGVLEWRSPTGRRYEDRPPATVRFVPSVEPERSVARPPF